MRIVNIIFSGLLCFVSKVYAQNEPVGDKYRFEFERKIINTKYRNVTRNVHSVQTLASFDNIVGVVRHDRNVTEKLKNQIALGIVYKDKANVNWYLGSMQSLTQRYRIYSVIDTSAVEVIGMGITPENKDFYRYHVVLNDSAELVPWKTPSVFENEHDAPHPYAVLGKFKALTNQLVVEVYDIRDYQNRDGVMLNWNQRMERLPKILQFKGVKGDWEVNFSSKDPNSRTFARQFNEQYNYPVDLRFEANTFYYLDMELDLAPGASYGISIGKIITNDSVEILYEKTNTNDRYIRLYDYQISRPGKYRIEISRISSGEWLNGLPGEEPVVIPFEVLSPPKETTYSLKQILPYAAATIAVAALLFYGNHRRNKIKFAKEARQKEMKQMQLRSLRNQLNPHFLFNSLSAIQNLINKNDVQSANRYLSHFAGLTRTVLDTSEEELISLEDELKMLEAYLQMEQLRFPFQYTIIVDEQLNKANTEIPAMLIQPFVENAVKHGVATLKEAGRVSINIQSDNKSLVLTIQDNGKGFDVGQPANGNNSIGLKLSRERIRLLNEMYGSGSIALTISSDTTGTMITINLEDWLS